MEHSYIQLKVKKGEGRAALPSMEVATSVLVRVVTEALVPWVVWWCVQYAKPNR